MEEEEKVDLVLKTATNVEFEGVNKSEAEGMQIIWILILLSIILSSGNKYSPEFPQFSIRLTRD